MIVKIKATKLPESKQTEYCKWIFKFDGTTYKFNTFSGGGTWWDCEVNDVSLFGANTKTDLILELKDYLEAKYPSVKFE